MEAGVCASEWEKAISYALEMVYKVDLIVDTLLPIIDGGIAYKELYAVRVDSKPVEFSWKQALADVTLVSQSTMKAVEGWRNAVTLSSGGLKKMLDARSAYQAVEKVYQIAGWYVGRYTNWEGYQRYGNEFSYHLFSFHFTPPRFFSLHVKRNVLLQLEAQSSLNSIPDSVGKLTEISQAEATENVRKAILTADAEIARIIHSIDRLRVDNIAPSIQKDKILENLMDVKNWADNWNQVVTSTGNAIWQIIQAIGILLSTVGKDDEQKEWIRVKNGARKLFQSWYPHMYAIQKLYHYTTKAEAGWHSLTNEKKQSFAPWYRWIFLDITEEAKEAIKAMQCIRYQFNWMYLFRDSTWRDQERWTQDHFTRISRNWTLFAAKFLKPGTQNQDNLPSPSLHFMENSPSLNIEQEAVRWMKASIPKTNQLILQAILFILRWKWPKDKEVSLLKVNESLEILKEVENWVSALSQAMSTSRYAIQEMVDALEIQAIVSKNTTYRERARSILQFWDGCISCITSLSQHIANAKESWQDLAASKEISTTTLSLNATSVNETKVKVAPSAEIHVNICVSLNPEQYYSSLYRHVGSITEEQKKAVDETRQVVRAAQTLRDAINDGYYRTNFTRSCITYNWLLLRHDLLNL
jgi:hypothetical protein